MNHYFVFHRSTGIFLATVRADTVVRAKRAVEARHAGDDEITERHLRATRATSYQARRFASDPDYGAML